MPVQTMYEGLYARFVQVAQVTRRLARFLAEHERLRVDKAESIDDDFAFDGLDGVDDDGDGTWCELLEGLLCIDIDG